MCMCNCSFTNCINKVILAIYTLKQPLYTCIMTYSLTGIPKVKQKYLFTPRLLTFLLWILRSLIGCVEEENYRYNIKFV